MARTIDSDVGYVRMFAPEGVADSRARKAVARVTLLCCIISVIVIAKSVWHVFIVPHDDDSNDSAQYIAIVVSCVLSLLIPACGYFGARDKNRNLLSGFLACNACCVFSILFEVVLSILGWSKYRGVDCDGFGESSTRVVCENYNDANATDYWAFACVQVLLAAVYSVASFWSWRVKKMPYFVQMENPGVEFSSGSVEMQRFGAPTWAQPTSGSIPVVAGVAISSSNVQSSVPTAAVAADDMQLRVA